MRTAQTKTIGEIEYTVNQLPPSQALDMLMDLVKMLGPGLAPIFSNAGSMAGILDKEVADLRTEFFGEAVKALCVGLDKEVTKRVIKTLAGVTTVAPGGLLGNIFEKHFMDHGLGAMFQWLPFALQTQYDDFFAVLGNAMNALPAPKATGAKE